MHNLSELIKAYLSMDTSGRVVFLELAKEFARSRQSVRTSLYVLPGRFGAQATPDRPGN